ncbi:MAG TPA: hypothetical protein VF510_13430, partial [Ktedonobacterales bacterium]
MTTPPFSRRAGAHPPANDSARGWSHIARRFLRGAARRWLLASLLSFWLALLALVVPLSARADTNSLTSYGATASGWALQPYIVNDSFINVPAADQSTPFVFVSMDNTPGAQAKASYFFPGTAVNAVPNTQGIPASVPVGVEARYPGTSPASGNVGGFNDGVASQAAAGSQSAQASEGYALAQSAIASYQFAPTIPATPGTGVPPVPGAPTVPPVPTLPGGATPTPTPHAGGGSTPTPAPGSSATPTPTPAKCVLPPVCLYSALPVEPSAQSAQGTGTLTPFKLPDPVEQQLAAALKAAELANPSLLNLAGGHLPTTNANLPYAGADVSSEAATRATDSGVVVAVVTRAQHVELLQGLITFASVESTLQATAPASQAHGTGTIITRITGAAIAGIPVTIDEKGVTVNDQHASADQIQALTDQLNAALAKAGIHIVLTKSVTKDGESGFWEGAGAGLEVTAELNPAGAGLPSPASGVPATHVDVSIGKVSASIYATPGTGSGGGNGGGDGSGGFGDGGCFFCGGGDGGSGGNGSGSGNGSGTSTQPAKHSGSKTFSLLAGLTGGQLLALVFVVQGVSTGAVAATAGLTD